MNNSREFSEGKKAQKCFIAETMARYFSVVGIPKYHTQWNNSNLI